MHFHERKRLFFIRISFNFVPEGPIDIKPALVQVMAWHIIWTNIEPFHWRIYAALWENELSLMLPR